MTGRSIILGLAGLLTSTAAMGVGLGPLTKEGVVTGPRKAFYLTVVNSDSAPVTYSATAVGVADEDAAPRVTIFPPVMRLGGYQNRQILIIASDLSPGETFRFRVCAERAEDAKGAIIHARVCSKLTARRLPLAAAAVGDAG